MLRGRLPPPFLERRLARAQEGDPASGLQYAGEGFEGKIEPLLPGEPRDDGAERSRTLVGTQLAWRRLATDRLAFGLARRIRPGERMILGGVPLLVVDAVDHAVEVGASLLEHAVKPIAELRCPDLGGIGP